jgi:hypothetical protein
MGATGQTYSGALRKHFKPPFYIIMTIILEGEEGNLHVMCFHNTLKNQ